MTRNGKPVTDSAARPPRPQLVERSSFTIDQNRPVWRAPRVISGHVQVRFVAGKPGSQIHYTFDGSEPGPNSPAYARPFTIDRRCTLRARTWQPDWRCGKNNWSETVSFEFEKQNPRPPVTVADNANGLLVKGYEIKTTLFDKKGFFQGSKNSLPDVRRFQPLVTTATPGFDIPVMQSREPRKRMMKAFYQFQGYFDAPETGVYSFEVESCGPVDLNMAGQSIILVNQQYGLSYKKRYGELALAKGKHKLSLVVCDPVFWKGDMEAPYEINVGVMAPGSDAYTPIAPAQFSRDADGIKMATALQKERRLHPAVQVEVVPGLIQLKYDRLDFLMTDVAVNPNDKSEAKFIPVDGIPSAYFDVKKAKPYSTAMRSTMAVE